MIAKSCIWKYYVKNKKEKKNDRRRENSRMSALVIGSLLRFKHTYTLSGLPSLDGFKMAIFGKKKSENPMFPSNDKINFSFQFLQSRVGNTAKTANFDQDMGTDAKSGTWETWCRTLDHCTILPIWWCLVSGSVFPTCFVKVGNTEWCKFQYYMF